MSGYNDLENAYLSSNVYQACADVADEAFPHNNDFQKRDNVKKALRKLSAAIIEQISDRLRV